jgi:SAM-dependent methyltransferase
MRVPECCDLNVGARLSRNAGCGRCSSGPIGGAVVRAEGHTIGVEIEPQLTAAYFDGWYADMVGSVAKDEIQQRQLGLPAHLLSTSLLSWQGIAEVVEALALSPGDTLLDLACGRGGYGLEIANRTGARLVGIDFSPEALRQARQHAHRLDRVAEFHIGDLAATGLDAGSIDAVVCVDAIQFAEPADAAYREIRRVLAQGGRAVLTCWEPVDRLDDRLPDRARGVDLAGDLTAAGFDRVEVRERPGWRASEQAMWEEAAGLDPGNDPALKSFHDEGVRVLENFDLMRRVMATATAPVEVGST